MVCVLPGCADVFARFFCAVSRLISEDLPTFERPIKANSGKPVVGQRAGSVLLVMNSADSIFKVHGES